MTRSRTAVGLAAAASLAIVGCGGAAPGISAPAAPAGAPPQPTSAPTYPPPPASPSLDDENRKGEDSSLSGQGATRTIDQLLGDLGAAEADALSAGKDCLTACRALRSMERAAEGICSLGGAEDERCTAARHRVDAAREKVTNSCGACPPPRGSVDSLH